MVGDGCGGYCVVVCCCGLLDVDVECGGGVLVGGYYDDVEYLCVFGGE